MVVTCMRVAGVGSFGGGKLLSGGGLSLRVEVFDFGLAKNATNVSAVEADRRTSKTYIQVLLVGER